MGDVAHPHCDQVVTEACRRFDEAVADGTYVPNGYTPAEARRARQGGTYRAWRVVRQQAFRWDAEEATR